jgi:tyrosine-specific transport protein
MFLKNRFIGGVLLVSGTAIGAGMLALPVITSFAGFVPSALALAFCWLFMYITAVLVLEVALFCPGEPNMISMAGRTLGVAGKIGCWGIYLLLLYSLTAAYIAGSAPLFLEAFQAVTNVALPDWVGPLPLLILFGLFVYLGTAIVDQVNRLLMLGLVITYLFLIAFLPAHVNVKPLYMADFSKIWMAIPVLFTSYGFHIIIPTLSTYLDHNRKKLHGTILIGSLIPFVVYLVWELLILGTVPPNSLYAAFAAGSSAEAPLSATLGSPWISSMAKGFSFFAIITSFLGVSLSLSDFLGDGLKLHRFTMGREIACLLTFVPPLFFVFTYPRGFMMALQYAGLFVALLLGILPALMAWKLKKFSSWPMRTLLIAIIAISLFVIDLCFH